jgi:predicted metal-dependent RNase
MSQVNYAAMSDSELKQYFLQNRQDREAMEVYLDRINQRPRQIIASPGDPDFNEKIQAAIRQKLQALESIQLKD